MQTTTLSYTKYGDTVVSLVTYLGAHEFQEHTDTATAGELALRLDIKEQEVKAVLEGFKGLFRRSQEDYETGKYGMQYRYTLHLRYARRKYVDGHLVELSKPLSSEDLFGLLNYVTKRIEEEFENERHSKTGRNTLFGVWVASTMSLLAAILGIVGLLIK